MHLAPDYKKGVLDTNLGQSCTLNETINEDLPTPTDFLQQHVFFRHWSKIIKRGYLTRVVH